MKQRNGAPAPKAEVRKKEVRSFVAGKSLQIRKSADGKMTLEGYAIRFGKPADLGSFTEYIHPKALDRTLRENPDVLMLRDHNQSLLLARTTAGNLKLTVDDKGLRFSADLLDTETARTAYTDIKGQLLTGMSFGFFAVSDDWRQEARGNLVRVVEDLDLFEISATSFPAYQSTEVDARSVRSKLGSNIATRDYEDCNEDEQDADGNCPGDPDYEDRSECRCDCRSCSEDRCEECGAEDCADEQCAADGCKYAGETETLRLRLRLHQHRRPIKSN